jgi:hypothetical protein
MRRGAIRWVRLVWLTTVVVVACPPASGHETQSVGPLRVTVGWSEEPAYTGLRNSVEVEVTSGAGSPVDDPAASLTVDVEFGKETVTLQLRPVGPGLFHAPMVPTRPGTYTFRINGTVSGQAVEIDSTCGEDTFDCVVGLGEIQFPARDPSTGELAERLDRELSRSQDAASGDGPVAAAALVVAVLALAAGALALRRRPVKD